MAIADLTLNTVTYAYNSDQNGVITWLDASGGIPTGFSSVDLSVRAPNKGGTAWRVEANFYHPVVATDDSACSCTGTVLRSEAAKIVVNLPVSGTTAERLDDALRIKDFVATTAFQNALKTLVRPG